MENSMTNKTSLESSVKHTTREDSMSFFYTEGSDEESEQYEYSLKHGFKSISDKASDSKGSDSKGSDSKGSDSNSSFVRGDRRNDVKTDYDDFACDDSTTSGIDSVTDMYLKSKLPETKQKNDSTEESSSVEVERVRGGVRGLSLKGFVKGARLGFKKCVNFLKGPAVKRPSLTTSYENTSQSRASSRISEASIFIDSGAPEESLGSGSKIKQKQSSKEVEDKSSKKVEDDSSQEVERGEIITKEGAIKFFEAFISVYKEELKAESRINGTDGVFGGAELNSVINKASEKAIKYSSGEYKDKYPEAKMMRNAISASYKLLNGSIGPAAPGKKKLTVLLRNALCLHKEESEKYANLDDLETDRGFADAMEKQGTRLFIADLASSESSHVSSKSFTEKVDAKKNQNCSAR